MELLKVTTEGAMKEQWFERGGPFAKCVKMYGNRTSFLFREFTVTDGLYI